MQACITEGRLSQATDDLVIDLKRGTGRNNPPAIPPATPGGFSTPGLVLSMDWSANRALSWPTVWQRQHPALAAKIRLYYES